MKPIIEALPLLQSPKKIFITTHHKPDGDAIGSMLGLYHYLKLKGHRVTLVAPSSVPDFLMWMPGVEAIIDHEDQAAAAENALRDADVVFCLDFNDPSRVKGLQQALEAATAAEIANRPSYVP